MLLMMLLLMIMLRLLPSLTWFVLALMIDPLLAVNVLKRHSAGGGDGVMLGVELLLLLKLMLIMRMTVM